MPATKTVYICINTDTGYSLHNKVMGTWNDGSKPNLQGNKVWTFAIKNAGLNSKAILSTIEHLGKLGFKHLDFVKVEVDAATNELVSNVIMPSAPALALEELTTDEDEISLALAANN